jgi:hypothetical protein
MTTEYVNQAMQQYLNDGLKYYPAIQELVKRFELTEKDPRTEQVRSILSREKWLQKFNTAHTA